MVLHSNEKRHCQIQQHDSGTFHENAALRNQKVYEFSLNFVSMQIFDKRDATIYTIYQLFHRCELLESHT